MLVGALAPDRVEYVAAAVNNGCARGRSRACGFGLHGVDHLGTRLALRYGTLSSSSVRATAQILGQGLTAPVRSLLAAYQNRREHTTTDKSVAMRMHQTMKECGVEPMGLAIYVHNGAVSVYGDVPDEDTRDALLTVATSQPGVRRIVDHLVVHAAA